MISLRIADRIKKTKNADQYMYECFLKSDEKDYPRLLTAYNTVNNVPTNLKNPKTYNEKMQWIKVYGKLEDKANLVDKYVVRSWVEQKIGNEYLIPLLGVWDSFDEIIFDTLPERFVLKANHGSGWNYIVTDKAHMDYSDAKAKFDKWMGLNFAFCTGFELQYKNVKPQIIAEEFIEDSNGSLQDYKFLCFNGEPKYCWVDVDRYGNHKRNVYDLEWNLQPWNQHYYGNASIQLQKPKNFDKMIELSTKLAKGFSHVRVDLYNLDGKIYFGEMTFTNSSGYEMINPEEYNIMLGKMWKL